MSIFIKYQKIFHQSCCGTATDICFQQVSSKGLSSWKDLLFCSAFNYKNHLLCVISIRMINLWILMKHCIIRVDSTLTFAERFNVWSLQSYLLHFNPKQIQNVDISNSLLLLQLTLNFYQGTCRSKYSWSACSLWLGLVCRLLIL